MEADPRDPQASVENSEDTSFEILTRELGALPTRVIVVEELQNCGVISKKKARKRITKILDEADLPESQA